MKCEVCNWESKRCKRLGSLMGRLVGRLMRRWGDDSRHRIKGKGEIR